MEIDTPEWFLRRWLAPLLKAGESISRDELVEAKYVSICHAIVIRSFTIEGLLVDDGGRATYAPNDQIARRGDMVVYRKDERLGGADFQLHLPFATSCYRMGTEEWRRAEKCLVTTEDIQLEAGRTKKVIGRNVVKLESYGIPTDVAYFISYQRSKGYWPKHLQDKYEAYSGFRYRDNGSKPKEG